MPMTDWSAFSPQNSVQGYQAQMEQLMGQGQQSAAAGEQAMLKVQQERQFADLVKGMRTGSDAPREQSDLPTQLDRISTMAMDAGLIGKATDLATKSAAIRKSQSETVKNKSLSDKYAAEQGIKQLETVGRLLDGVKDQNTWQQANTLYAMTTGNFSPYADMAYSPELVERLKAGALGQKDKLTLQLREREIENHEANTRSMIDFRNFRKTILSKNADTARMRAERVGKTGGTDVGAPSKAEVSQAEDMVAKEFKNLPGDETIQAGYDIAARAKAIRKANPGLDASQALNQAFIEAKAAGDLKTIDDGYGIGSWRVGGKEGYKPSGKSIRSAAEVPMVGDKPDIGRLVEGRFYNVGGKVYQRVKGGWTEAQYTAPMEEPGEEAEAEEE